MGDGISEGAQMAKDSAEKNLLLLETLRKLIEMQPGQERFQVVLGAISGRTRFEQNQATITRATETESGRLAEKLYFEDCHLVPETCHEKETAWASFIWDLLNTELICQQDIRDAVAELSILPLDLLLAFGTVLPKDGKPDFWPKGMSPVFKTWDIPPEQLASWDASKNSFLMGWVAGSKGNVRIYFF